MGLRRSALKGATQFAEISGLQTPTFAGDPPGLGPDVADRD